MDWWEEKESPVKVEMYLEMVVRQPEHTSEHVPAVRQLRSQPDLKGKEENLVVEI